MNDKSPEEIAEHLCENWNRSTGFAGEFNEDDLDRLKQSIAAAIRAASAERVVSEQEIDRLAKEYDTNAEGPHWSSWYIGFIDGFRKAMEMRATDPKALAAAVQAVWPHFAEAAIIGEDDSGFERGNYEGARNMFYWLKAELIRRLEGKL